MEYIITSPDQMIKFGQSLLTIGHKFLVHGSLGAGKTHLCKGYAQALEIDPQQVKSPTYTYFHEYEHKLFHGDFYRIEDPSILTLRGIIDTLQEHEYCFIERPHYPEYYADPSRHTIMIQHDLTLTDHRIVTVQPYS